MKVYLLIVWSLFSISLYAQNTIDEFHYWFDSDYASRVELPTGNVPSFSLNTYLDASFLNSGLHSVNAIAKDNSGQSSLVSSNFFYKLPAISDISSPTIVEMEYWFDDDYTNLISNTTDNNFQIVLNTNYTTTDLTEGLHVFNARFKDEVGQWSTVQSNFFYKLPSAFTIPNPAIVEVEYWFDDDYTNLISNTIDNNFQIVLNTNYTTTDLTEGLHIFNMRFKDDEEQWSTVQSNFFYKTPNDVTVLKDIVAYEYWFNDDYANTSNFTISEINLFDLDTFVVPENVGLGIGNHYFNLRFQDSAGIWSSIISEPFDISTLDIEIFSDIKGLKLYPNPTSRTVNFSLGKFYGSVEIKVFDSSGRLLKQMQHGSIRYGSINLDVPSGLYVLSFTADNEQAVRKVLKN